MKKVIFALMLVPIISFAGEKPNSLQQMMKSFEKATVNILRGFLYDNDKQIIENAHIIANHPSNPDEMLKYVRPERRTANFKRLLINVDNIVKSNAKEIEIYMKQGKKNLASEKFANMLKGCNSCHAIFRGW